MSAPHLDVAEGKAYLPEAVYIADSGEHVNVQLPALDLDELIALALENDAFLQEVTEQIKARNAEIGDRIKSLTMAGPLLGEVAA